MKRLAGILTFSVLVFGLLMHFYNTQTLVSASTECIEQKEKCINNKWNYCVCDENGKNCRWVETKESCGSPTPKPKTGCVEQTERCINNKWNYCVCDENGKNCRWVETKESCGSPTKKPEPTKTTPKPTKTTPIPTQQPKPPKKPKPSKTTSRPNYCQSATISTNTLGPGQSLTITSTANNNKITKFTYAFYNLDNLNGPNDPKSIMFSKDKIYTVVKNVSPTNKQTITVNYADLDKPDLNWGGKKPTKIQVNAYFSTGSDFSLPAAPCVVKFNLRPNYCQSATISTNTLGPGQSLTITSTANNNKITKFTYAFYNLDNLNGPNDPKSIMFSKDKIYTVVKSVSPTNKQTITVNYADLDKPDLNWGGKKPTKIQVNAYFSTGSDFSLPAAPCVVKFNLRPRSTRIAITPTPANTPTPTPTTRPPTPSCSKKTSGDANCDGLINGADLTIWKCQAAGQTNCGQPNLAADFDLSGSVDLNDFEIWRQNNYQE